MQDDNESVQTPTLLATYTELKLTNRSPVIAAEKLLTKVVEIRLNCSTFSRGFARDFDSVRSMYRADEDGFVQRWVVLGLVPCINRQLTGYHGRSLPMPIIERFEDVSLLLM